MPSCLKSFGTNTSFQRALVLGAAGISGRAVARLLVRLGKDVLLVDRKHEPAFPAQIMAAINEGQAAFFSEEDLLKEHKNAGEALEREQIDFVVTAPGIPLSHPILEAARLRKIPLWGELDFSYHILTEIYSNKNLVPLLAITGTDGKSTTTALLTHLIKQASNHYAVAAGNYGFPLSLVALSLLSDLDFRASALPAGGQSSLFVDSEEEKIFQEIQRNKDRLLLVVENSSFQLELIESYHPQIALFLNLAEDHLDRYASLEDYLRAKLGMLKNMTSEDLLLASPDVLHKINEMQEIPCAIAKISEEDLLEDIFFEGQRLMPVAEFSQPGVHNRLNLEFALHALSGLKERLSDSDGRHAVFQVDQTRLIEAIRGFRGLKHRLELIKEIKFSKGGCKALLRFVNDSKATTVHAVQSAIRCYEDHEVFLLLGGRAKETDFSSLKYLSENDAAQRVDSPSVRFFPYGESGKMLASVLDVSEFYPDLESAFEAALAEAESVAEDACQKLVILLSPACASYDAYSNYMERGEHFRRLVEKKYGNKEQTV